MGSWATGVGAGACHVPVRVAQRPEALRDAAVEGDGLEAEAAVAHAHQVEPRGPQTPGPCASSLFCLNPRAGSVSEATEIITAGCLEDNLKLEMRQESGVMSRPRLRQVQLRVRCPKLRTAHEGQTLSVPSCLKLSA